MSFPPQFLEELRARLSLSEVAGRRIRLMRAGREFKALCPFHKEKTPSFTLNDHKGFFHCFGCGAHGDVIGFVMRHDNLSFLEAIELLAPQAGLPIPRAEAPERARYQKEKRLFEAVETACRWFEAQLGEPRGSEALAYLHRRGLDDSVIRRFRLGYAPPEGAALRSHLAGAGFTDEEQIEAGLTRRPDDGRPPYSFFRHRVLFPVADRRGRVVAFGGRLLSGDGPKYINTGETALFHKGELLYGLSRARQAAADGGPVVVVEGYLDVVAMVEAGYPGTVAPLGTALTDTQILALWRLIPGRDKLPILCFDGDPAGRKAALRAIERVLPLLAPDQSVRIAFLPEGEDPDSLIRRTGPAAIAACLDQARPLIEVLWQAEREGRRLETPEARAGLKAALLERVNTIADRTVQALYRQELTSRWSALFYPGRRDRDKPGAPQGKTGPAAAAAGRPGGWTGPGPGAAAGGWRSGAAPTGGRWPRGVSPAAAARDGARAALAADKRQRPPGQDGLRDRLLLAAILQHPWLIEEIAEDLALLPLNDPDHEPVRTLLLELSRDCPLPAQDLAARLAERLAAQPLAAVVAGLTDPALARLARFIRADAPAELVRESVRGLLAQPSLQRLSAERSRLTETCRAAPTRENLNRLLAVTRELRDGQGAVLDDLDPDPP